MLFHRTLTNLFRVIFSPLTSLIIITLSLLDHPVKIALKRGFIRAPICSIYLNITFDHQYKDITKIIQKKNEKEVLHLFLALLLKIRCPPI